MEPRVSLPCAQQPPLSQIKPALTLTPLYLRHILILSSYLRLQRWSNLFYWCGQFNVAVCS
jgi:hypothetical protein